MKPPHFTKEVRRVLCSIAAAATLFVVFTATAVGGNGGSSCNAPGNHYGFSCDPAPSGTTDVVSPPATSDPAPAQPAPAVPAKSEPIPTPRFRVPTATAGGMCRVTRA